MGGEPSFQVDHLITHHSNVGSSSVLGRFLAPDAQRYSSTVASQEPSRREIERL
jgi:hypothetical protein